MYLHLLAFLREEFALIVLLSIVLHFFYNRYGRGLRRFNGPVLASFSSLWRVMEIWRYGDPVSSIALHKKYGNIVRMSSTTISFSHPEAVRDIYGHGGLIQKSDFHLVPQQVVKGRSLPSVFATTDTKRHDDLRKRIFSAFSMASMRSLEGYVDDTIKSFLQHLEYRFANRLEATATVDFPTWLHYYADDAVTAMSYGTAIGHMNAGEDKFGVLASVYRTMRYLGLVGYMPSLDLLLWKNPIFMWLSRYGYTTSKMSSAVAFAMGAQQ
jgi:hypothetical protein